MFVTQLILDFFTEQGKFFKMFFLVKNDKKCKWEYLYDPLHFSDRTMWTVELQKFRNANRNAPHCFFLNKFLHALVTIERRFPPCVLAQHWKKKKGKKKYIVCREASAYFLKFFSLKSLGTFWWFKAWPRFLYKWWKPGLLIIWKGSFICFLSSKDF